MKTKILFFFALILCLSSCKDDEPVENFFVNTTWKRALDTSGSRYEVLKFYSGGRFDNYKETANKITYEIKNTSNSSYRVDEGNYKIFLNYSNEIEVTITYEGTPPIYIITSNGNFVRQME